MRLVRQSAIVSVVRGGSRLVVTAPSIRSRVERGVNADRVVAHGVSARVAASDLVGLDQDVSDRVLGGLGNCHWAELTEAGKSVSGTARWRISGWNLGPWNT